MIRLIDIEAAGYETISLPGRSRHGNPADVRGEAYHVDPQPDGSLIVDPEISLPSPGMDVHINQYYNSNFFGVSDAPSGVGRTISTNLTLYSTDAFYTPMWAVQRGNGTTDYYMQSPIDGLYYPNTPGLVNSLIYDSAGGFWRETTPEGLQMAYPIVGTGQISSIAYVQDAVGNRHTFAYKTSGVLQSLQDAVGRLVTFAYTTDSHLQTIQDWANRLTTFGYVPSNQMVGQKLLATITGPTGCLTGYGYNYFDQLTSITDPNGFQTTYAYHGFSPAPVMQRTIVGAGMSQYTYPANAMVTVDPLGAITTYITDAFSSPIRSIDPTGVVTSFTNMARVQTGRRDMNGAVTTTIYDSNNRPIATIDALGHCTTLLRDAYSNPTTVIYADGTITSLIWGYAGSPFDTTGTKRRLQAKIDALGHLTSYSYNPRGQMTAMQDALGRYTTYSYDAWGNRIATMDPLGNITSQLYDLAGNVTAIIDPLGNTWTTTYDKQNRPTSVKDPLGFLTTTAYDGVGNILLTIDALGNRWSYSYNAFDKPTQIIDPLGRYTTLSYDPLGRPISAIDAIGRVFTTSYDLAGRVISNTDPLGFLTSYLYDSAGRPQATVDALGRVTTVLLDLAGNEITLVNALGQCTTKSYDPLNRPIAITDALNRTGTVVYDAIGRRQAAIDPLGNTASFVYDAVDNLVSVQNALGNVVTIGYDPARRLTSVQTPLGFVTSFNYDNAYRQISAQDPLGYLHTNVYDPRGLLVAQQDPLGFRATLQYDALQRPTAAIDANGRIVTAQYDPLGKVTSQQDARGYLTSFIYDPVNRLTAVVTADGNRTSRIYDPRDNVLARQDPLGYFTSFQYDAVSNATLRTDARNFATTYTRDSLNRLVGVLYPDSSLVTQSFDAAGQQILLGDSTGNTNYAYDLAGRGVQMQYGNGQAVSYAYDAVGNRIQMRDPDGGITRYGYDAQRRLTQITNRVAEITTFTYDPLNREVNKVLANGMQTQHFFDPAGRNTQLFNLGPTGIGLANFTYAYDPVGQVLGALEIDGTRVTYAYDPTYQLLNEQRSGANAYNISYTYDPMGNRLQQNNGGVLTTLAYDAANQLKSLQTGASFTTFAFDPNGNRYTAKQDGQITTNTWDFENRLTNIQYSNGTSEAYTYQANGQRRQKVTSTVSRIFVWDGPLVLQETDLNLITKVQYTDYPGIYGGLVSLWQPGARSGALFNASQFNTVQFNQASASGPLSRFYAFDRTGNARLLADSSGTVTDTYLNTSFGVQLATSGSTVNPYQFGGKWRYYTDQLNRLKAGARDLDVTTGGWLKRDPIGFLGRDWNLYRYGGSDPVNTVDPSGLILPLIAAAAVAAPTLLAGGLTNVGISYSLNRGFDPCHPYTRVDAAKDFLIGVTLTGAFAALGKGLQAAYRGVPLFFHGGEAYDASLINSGTRQWATSAENLSPSAYEIGGNYNLNGSLRDLSVTSTIPPEIAAQYDPAFSPNPLSWWKGTLGQFSYQAPGWQRTILGASQGVSAVGGSRTALLYLYGPPQQCNCEN